ncbi:hypothetical protein HMPREF9459_01486 [Streptococcus anginosus 1_2_62CV]|uniref:hypothetical protein n=1 Tax=Streptococcus anginosus TaxID=1328 RepID=UPI0001F605AD|nr:hypothetical protein [Streptococcus anginosus]EFW06944.1 hypothetical protein HMPREF9459_01486 [Streptococcus anginosus 1_2_62CV]MCW1065661.1 hypothetical protein [Streptococcus anginosus]MCY7212982.1 hypothetical protein [Streptococcus anginosus]
MSDKIPILTGGILFGLILEARNPRTRVRSREVDKNDGLTEVDIMLSLLEIFTGESQPRPQGTTFKKNVSDYKKCATSTTTYLPFDNQAFVDSFRDSIEQNKKDKLESMSVFISEKLSEQRLGRLVSAIIETICNDEIIDESEQFKISINDTVSKLELLDITIVEIEPFLLDVMRYIFVNKIDNTLGKTTFETWYSQNGANTVWEFSNTELGKSLPDIEITRYNRGVEQVDDVEESLFEEVFTDTKNKSNFEPESDESIKQQILNNPKIINQHAQNIYNIEHVENLN